MKKPNLFDNLHSLSIDRQELNNPITFQIPNNLKYDLDKYKLEFPYNYFTKILRNSKLRPLEDNLFRLWKKHLPEKLHENCPFDPELNNNETEKNCFIHLLEFQTLYILSGIRFSKLIQTHSNILRKITKERLAILFYEKAFLFNNGQSFFQVGEMCRLLLKEGLQDISFRLKEIETNIALEISNQNFNNISKQILLNDNGFRDVEKLQKKFWKVEKDNYQTRLLLEKESRPSFIDYFIKGILELQTQEENQECIRNIRNQKKLEAPFRNFFKAILSQNFDSVESEPEKGSKRIDLKVQDRRLDFSIIIEFKGWWNRDKINVSQQTLDYLTDFEKEGYILLINHLKKKNIIDEYKKKIVLQTTHYKENSWKPVKYKNTDYTYYTSEHIFDNKIKILNHFIFDANK